MLLCLTMVAKWLFLNNTPSSPSPITRDSWDNPWLVTCLSRRFVHLDIQIIVSGPSRGHDVKYYQQYLEHLYQQVQELGVSGVSGV